MLKLLIDRGYLPKWVGSLLFWVVGVPLVGMTVIGLFFAVTGRY